MNEAPLPDGLLLRRYRAQGDEAAFAELRRRHERLVFATCRREIGDANLAEDAAQGTFLLLMEKSFSDDASLAGWLFGAARLVSKNLLREESRRRRRERRAFSEFEEPAAAWEAIEPHLNDALAGLKDVEREAILLRFAGERSLAEVGQTLGIAENAARMRVARAIERMRAHLRRAGVGVSAALLASLLSTRTADAAPVSSAGAPRARVVRVARATASTIAWTPFIPLLWVAPLVLVGGLAYRVATAGPPRLGRAEASTLLARSVGGWKGTLEFADDATRRRTKTATNVVIDRPNGGLRLIARFPSFSNIDTTTFAPDPDGRYRIDTGGPNSSHRLDGLYDLIRLRDGTPAFLGESAAVRSQVRLTLQVGADRFSLLEEVQEGAGFRFRNRYDLVRTP